MAVTVDIYVKDSAVVPQPIQSVVVGVFNPITFAPVAQALTDVTGKASFLLPGSASPGTQYEVRFFKLGVFFANPVAIAVLDPVTPPDSNIFDFSGVLTSPGVPTDPRVCRCYGRFVNYSNQPIPNATVRVFATQEAGFEQPLIVDGNLVASQTMYLKTDANGYLKVDLHRGGEYKLMYAGEEEVLWTINVPDQPYINFTDLLHPYPVSISYDPSVAPGNAVSVQVGVKVEVPFSALFSNYLTITHGLLEWLLFTNGDDTKLDLWAGNGFLEIQGKAVGVATVTGANRPELKPTRVPYYNTSVPTLTVTVTP